MLNRPTWLCHAAESGRLLLFASQYTPIVCMHFFVAFRPDYFVPSFSSRGCRIDVS